MTSSRSILTTEGENTSAPSPLPSRDARPVAPGELREWLSDNEAEISKRWLLEVRTRVDALQPGVEPLLGEFLRLLVRFLPTSVAGIRDQVEPLYQQAAEYYGNLGAMRGLAAGEAVEEFQLLREILLRVYYGSPPGGDGLELGLREALRLHRWVDIGVTYTSVGHTDTMFFNLFQGAGVPGVPTSEFLAEVRGQIEAIGTELDRVLRFERREAAARPV